MRAQAGEPHDREHQRSRQAVVPGRPIRGGARALHRPDTADRPLGSEQIPSPPAGGVFPPLPPAQLAELSRSCRARPHDRADSSSADCRRKPCVSSPDCVPRCAELTTSARRIRDRRCRRCTPRTPDRHRRADAEPTRPSRRALHCESPADRDRRASPDTHRSAH